MLDWITQTQGSARSREQQHPQDGATSAKRWISRCGLSELICHAIHINSDSDADTVVLQAKVHAGLDCRAQDGAIS
jgi:hypothetical protein